MDRQIELNCLFAFLNHSSPCWSGFCAELCINSIRSITLTWKNSVLFWKACFIKKSNGLFSIILTPNDGWYSKCSENDVISMASHRRFNFARKFVYDSHNTHSYSNDNWLMTSLQRLMTSYKFHKKFLTFDKVAIYNIYEKLEPFLQHLIYFKIWGLFLDSPFFSEN